MKKLKEHIKTALKTLGKYSGELVVAFAIAVPTMQLAIGMYFQAINGYMFAIIMTIGIMFQNKYYDVRRAYLELWYTLEAWAKVAKHHGRELVIEFKEDEKDGKSTISSSMDRVIPAILPSEALYGFAAWLTSRPEETVMSDHHDAAKIADIVNQFVKANELAEPRSEYYPANITRMGDKEPNGKVDVSEGSGKVAMHDITT